MLKKNSLGNQCLFQIINELYDDLSVRFHEISYYTTLDPSERAGHSPPPTQLASSSEASSADAQELLDMVPKFVSPLSDLRAIHNGIQENKANDNETENDHLLGGADGEQSIGSQRSLSQAGDTVPQPSQRSIMRNGGSKENSKSLQINYPSSAATQDSIEDKISNGLVLKSAPTIC